MAAPIESWSEDVFGNSSLFQEFSTTAESCKQRKARKDLQGEPEKNQLEAEIEKLRKENQRLKSWLKVCIQTKGYKVSDGKRDGPIAQVVYMNHDSVCKYRHEVETFFEQLCMRSLHHQNVSEAGKTKYDDARPLPQRSSMVLTENPDPETKEAFTATGNVQYYLSFCLDPLGRPLVDGNAQLTEGWEIPHYPSVFREVLPIDDKPNAPVRSKRVKAACFNCGNEKHSLRDCPQPRDLVRISQNKKLFMDKMESSPASTSSLRRYHKDAEMEKKYKPGVISDALREALGISSRQLPPYIYQMRSLGYPPGHLLDSQVHKSELKVYNTMVTDEEGEVTSGDERENAEEPFYNLKKLIDFPGFNVVPDNSIRDEWRKYNAIPMQPCHRKEVMELHLRPMAVEEEMRTPVRKNRNSDFAESNSSKRRKIDRAAVDMEIETDQSGGGTPCRGWFQPPLPPTPEIETPPPLPPGPAPPTPVRTPRRDSPGMSSLDDTLPMQSDSGSWRTASRQNSQASSRSGSPDLDRLMIERTKLLAALDNQDDSTLSSSDAMPSGADTAEDDDERPRERKGDGLEDGQKKLQDPAGEERIREDRAEIPPETRSENGAKEAVGDRAESSAESDARTEADWAVKDLPDSSTASDSECRPKGSDADVWTDETVFATRGTASDEEKPNRSGVPHRRKFSVNIMPHTFEEEQPAKMGIFQKILGVLKRDKK